MLAGKALLDEKFLGDLLDDPQAAAHQVGCQSAAGDAACMRHLPVPLRVHAMVRGRDGGWRYADDDRPGL